jgi:hypothetical protein
MSLPNGACCSQMVNMAPVKHMWLPYGTICLSNGAIRLPNSACGSHIMHTTPAWSPYNARGSHMAPSISHACTELTYGLCNFLGENAGTQLPYGSCNSLGGNAGCHMVPPVYCQLAPELPPLGTGGSHMVSSTFHMAHRAPIWCRQLHTVHVALKCTICLPFDATWLPYGTRGSQVGYTAPIQCTWLH